MESSQGNHGTRAGMIGGLLFVFLGASPEEIVKTIYLAAIGATVSFLISLALRWMLKKWKCGK
jgi:hypothetical protein